MQVHKLDMSGRTGAISMREEAAKLASMAFFMPTHAWHLMCQEDVHAIVHCRHELSCECVTLLSARPRLSVQEEQEVVGFG